MKAELNADDQLRLDALRWQILEQFLRIRAVADAAEEACQALLRAARIAALETKNSLKVKRKTGRSGRADRDAARAKVRAEMSNTR